MIRYFETFDTEDQAKEYRENMYRNYHPLGYSTNIRIGYDPVLQKWVAQGSRAESCD
jgi:hypothetical protein